MAQISQEILSSAGFKNLANEAPADSLDKDSVSRVHKNAKKEIDDLKIALQTTGQNAVLNEHFKDQKARKALLDLIDEVEKTPINSAVVAATPIVLVTSAGPTNNPSQELVVASTRATVAMENKLGKLTDKNAKEFLGAWQRVWSKVPGTEPTDMEDIGQAINQSRGFNEKLIAALTFEYDQNTTTLPVGWFSNMPGWFPALQKNHNFGTTAYNGKIGVEGKKAYILDTINTLALKWEQASSSNPEWLVNTVETIATWALPVFGYPALLLFAGKVGYNILHDGIKKPGIGEAVGWSSGKVWDGTKKVFTFGKSTITTGYKSVNGKFATKVEAKDLKDTPAYTLEDWGKERARLEETTRRMIYMDSGVNPRHNPNATLAEIFHDVENTPALKSAYDARMVKLTELGNTLVGQEKYLSPDAFNKAASRIVAGDIANVDLQTKILRKIPRTPERNDYKQTQAALKKVKGEIDTMRARLQAKATMDGVEIPKILEAQLQAFENAHKAAYESDLALDKARNTIARTGDQINAINEVIVRFEQIDILNGKIGDTANGLTKEIADLKAKMTGNTTAVYSEDPSLVRQREIDGKEGEIKAANDKREQAIRESDVHETAKRETLKDKRFADQAVLEDENRIRKELADRKTFLQDQITKNSSDNTKANAITEWQDEIAGNRGKVKELTDQLTPPHTGSTLIAKKQAAKEIQDRYDDLVAKDTTITHKITTIETEISQLSSQKTGILSRAAGVNATAIQGSDQVELTRLQGEKTEMENKIKTLKGEIDAISGKPENRGFHRSNGGTLVIAQNELARMEGLIAPAAGAVPAGSLITAKDTAKANRDGAFTHMNTTITALNTESARLGGALEVKIPHITEFQKGQAFSEDISMREHGATGDKVADQKLKGTRPKVVETVMKRGK